MNTVTTNREEKSSLSILARFLLFVVMTYQKLLSPFLHAFGPACRFHPTCSEYAKQSIIKYGLWTGTIKAMKRISKCHPFHPGGIDHP
ncbi:MAG: membrane protein insertion efficiency factor YidD [Myxococcota bacterium]|nr:membrane protein insertion efficiency factor YidD [Myxococcota bacterium]